MSKHGNRHDSEKRQSLYVVYDHEFSKIYYFGITDGQLDQRQMSARLKYHIKKGNKIAGYIRFTGRTLRSSIPHRLVAREVEDHCITTYRKKYGNNYPAGNTDHVFLSEKEKEKLKALGDQLFGK